MEIGSARGKSTCYVGWALKRNGYGKLYAIDPHTRANWNDRHSADSFEIMKDNLDLIGVEDTVEIVR